MPTLSLSEVNNISKYLADNSTVTFTGKFVKIKKNKHVFSDQNNLILCKFKKNPKITINDIVIIEGRLKLPKNLLGSIYINVDSYQIYGSSKITHLAERKYHKLYKALQTPNCEVVLQKIYNVEPPDNIKNIGIILPEGHDDVLNKFIAQYKIFCTGNIWIFRICRNISNNILVGLSYFKSYHEIDIICILCDNLSMTDIIQMSSEKCIKFMLSRNEFPYIISVTSKLSQYTNPPLINTTSNMNIVGIYYVIEYIRKIQSSYRKKIRNLTINAENIMNLILTDYSKKISEYKNMISEFLPNMNSNIDINGTIIKYRLESLLMSCFVKLHEYTAGLAKNILTEIRTKTILNEIIKSDIELYDNIDTQIDQNNELSIKKIDNLNLNQDNSNCHTLYNQNDKSN